MGKNSSPEKGQEKHTKHMETFKYLNTLREEITKKINDDPYLEFKKMDHKEKSKELLDYFNLNTWSFDKDTTTDDIISHFRKNLSKINFLIKIDYDE